MNWLARLILRLLPRAVIHELPEDRTQLALDRGRRSQYLLTDETLAEAFAEIEAKLLDGWKSTPSPAAQQREAIFNQVAALQSVRDQLKRWSEDAKFVAAQIEKRR